MLVAFMTPEKVYSLEYQREFPSLPTEIPGPEEIDTIVSGYAANRSALAGHANEMGLNPEWFTSRHVIVGPFFHPSPVSSAYGGRADNYRQSLQITDAIAQGLANQGYEPVLPEQVILASKDFKDRGITSSAYLVLPKNTTTNEAAALVGKEARGQAYKDIAVNPDKIAQLIKRLHDQRGVYTQRVKIVRESMDEVMQAITSDIQRAYDGSEGTLIAFIDQLNAQCMSRVSPQIPRTSALPIDSTIYNDFLKSGIADLDKFSAFLSEIGFFQDEVPYLRYGNQTERGVDLKTIVYTNGMYIDTKSNTQVSPDELQSSDYLLPAKELAYLLNFGSIVPTIYGERNETQACGEGGTDYYHPYAMARAQLERASLQPVFYCTQDPVPASCQNPSDFGTVYDFYKGILYP